jgi:hypothetical protein
MGKTERSNGAFGKSDIEGKAAMDSGERAGQRTSFKWAGAHESAWAANEFQIFTNLDQERRHVSEVCVLASYERRIKREAKLAV